jgi:RNA polymerase sigma-70 factor, ECF subfamily
MTQWDRDLDDAVIAEARSGSTAAFTAVVEAYQARVRGYLARWVGDRTVVDDLAQEVFIAAFRNLKDFDGAVPIGAWLAGIARNQALNHLRGERRRRARDGNAVEAALHEWHLQELEAEGDRLAWRLGEVEVLRECLAALDDEQRALIDGHYLQGRSCAELARERNRDPDGMRMIMLRIRQTLRACLERRLGDEELA